MNPDPSRPDGEMPTQYDALVDHIVDRMEGRTSAEKRSIVQQMVDRLSVAKGLPTIKADFNAPGISPGEARRRRRAWMRDHELTIGKELRHGCQPRKVDEGPRTAAVAIPLHPNIVTDRFAQELLRNVVAPESGSTPMIAQFGATSQSQYKFMAVNAMGVGTDSEPTTVGDTQLGAAGDGGADSDQFCIYHIDESVSASTNDGTFGDSITADVDADLPLDTAQGVQASARDSGGTYHSGTRSPSDAAATLSHNDDSPGAGDFEFVYDFTWRRGTDGDERDGNFGSDASPVAWREVGLANALMTGDSTNIHPAGAHPDSVYHQATRRVFSGTGFAKTSDVQLSIEYTVRFSSG